MIYRIINLSKIGIPFRVNVWKFATWIDVDFIFGKNGDGFSISAWRGNVDAR